MDALTLPLLILGFFAGIMSGLFGIGGGALIVPILMIFFGFTQIAANGTSLAALMFPVGIFAVIEYRKAGKLWFVPAAGIAVGLTFGAWVGANIALDLPADTLRSAYGVFLLLMAWRYIAPRQWLLEWRGEPMPIQSEDEFNRDARRQWIVFAITFVIGLAAGVFSGLFGIGGGVIIVPALLLILKFDFKLATGTSLGALLMPVGLLGVLRYSQANQLDLGTAVPVAIGLVIGSFFGARLALGLSTKTVRRAYGFFLLFVGLRFILNF